MLVTTANILHLSKYSIKDLERLSGIKAHTIRIWEQRYNLLSPERSDTNIRSYSNEELKRLLNVSMLNKCGVKISRIAEMNPEEIAKEAASLMTQHSDQDDLINGLVTAMIDMDELFFNSMLSQAITQFGFEKAVLNTVYPFMDRIGVMWQTGSINPAQEHFVSNLVRQKFIVAIDAITIPIQKSSPKFILFLPENELHELGLLFYNYILRYNGYKTFYLGQSVPYDDLSRVIEITQPDYLFTIITSPGSTTVKDFLTILSNDFSSLKIWAFGAAINQENITSFNNVFIPAAPQDLFELIKQL